MHPNTPQDSAKAALIALIILHVVMLGSLYAQVPPHPPASVVLFGIGPFVSAALAITAAALVFGATATRPGAYISILSALVAIVSFGPQKWLDAAISQIWPAVLLGQISAAAIFVSAAKALRAEAGVR